MTRRQILRRNNVRYWPVVLGSFSVVVAVTTLFTGCATCEDRWDLSHVQEIALPRSCWVMTDQPEAGTLNLQKHEIEGC